jgi:hypothetical protein
MENTGLQVLAHCLIGLATRVKPECEPCLPVFGVHPIDACPAHSFFANLGRICKFQRKREHEMSLNGPFSSDISAKYFNVIAKKVQIFSAIAK